MNAFKESLYSIDDAKALSLHLSGSKQNIDVENTSPYIQFSSGTQVKQGVVPVEKVADSSPSEQPLAVPDEPFNSWEAMLKWCLEVTESKSCFVVDPQGFILMRDGEEFSDDGFEGAGANLKLAIEQLRQMALGSGEVQIMDLAYRKQGMLIVQVNDADNDIYTLCFIGFSAVSEAQKKALYQQIQKSVLKLA